jgi:hypothetical protein
LGGYFNSPHLLLIASLFVLGGSIGYGVYTFLASRYVYNKITHIDMERIRVWEEFWQCQMRPRIIDIFYNLAKELQGLHKKYYTLDDDSLPLQDNELKAYIEDVILPHEKTYSYKSSLNAQKP